MREPYDSGDLDAISELLISPGFQLYAERLEQEQARLLRELESKETLAELRYLQGGIKSLRTALAIPGILKDEIQAVIKE